MRVYVCGGSCRGWCEYGLLVCVVRWHSSCVCVCMRVCDVCVCACVCVCVCLCVRMCGVAEHARHMVRSSSVLLRVLVLGVACCCKAGGGGSSGEVGLVCVLYAHVLGC